MLKKRLLLTGVIFSVFSNIIAQHDMITISTTHVGPNVVHRKYIAPSVPWNIDVLDIDISNPYISIESVKADNLLNGYECVSSMASRNSYKGHFVVGAINGDFFGGNGVPVNSQVVNGEIVNLESVNPDNPIYWPTIAFDENQKPSLEINSYSGSIAVNSNYTDISEINRGRGINDLILYNSFRGNTTNTDNNGTEILISPLYEWFVNDTIQCLIESKVAGAGNMSIPDGKAVLSGNGTKATFLNDNITVGDTIKLFLGLSPSISKLKHLIGGFPTIVKGGQNYAVQGYHEEGGSSTFHTDYHPRTAVGFSVDSTILYFITVDGRQDISRGMNLIELADFMISIGVYKGMNLDGGGSTTIIVRDKVQNSPSDVNERLIANSLLAISSAPSDSLFVIQCEPDNLRMFVGESVRFTASGWDQYFNPVDINAAEFEFLVDEHFGNVDENGLFTASSISDSGWLFVKYENLIDSAYIYLKTISHMSISPKICVIDTIQSMNFKVVIIDEDGQSQYLPKNHIQWQSLNPTVGIIDSTGIFKGKTEGTTAIVASCYDFSDTALVSVKICEGTVTLDPIDNATIWSISGLNYDIQETELSVVDSPKTYGTGSFKVDYQFLRLATERSYIYLNTDIYVNGIPESIDIDFLSDGAKHKAYIVVSDGDDELFKTYVSDYLQDTTKFNTYGALTSNFAAINPNSTLNYPVRIKQIQIRLGTTADVGEINSGTFFFDNLKIVYPSALMVGHSVEDAILDEFRLGQNYPNPFNPTTVIPFRLEKESNVKLLIYDIAGHSLDVIVNNKFKPGNYEIPFIAGNMSSSIYIYTLEVDGRQTSRKMLLLK